MFADIVRVASVALLALAVALAPAPSLPVQPAQDAQPVVDVVRVHDDESLRAALGAARPGMRIEIAAGRYAGGLYVERLRGEPGRRIAIAGADPADPPRFVGGACGLHLVEPMHVDLVDLCFTGATDNGVNIDDGGRYVDTPRGLVLRRLRITDIGPRGNHDGLKLSGIRGFRIEDCVLERWGIGGGSGIDLVGCSDGAIEHNTLRHSFDAGATGGSGIQAKGGSCDVAIRHNRFEHAGARAVNLGGSTGLAYFRPPIDAWRADLRFEASRLLVEGNLFVGSSSPIAFVGVDGSIVRRNTFVAPGKWILRILQETREPGFVPCRGGEFSDNVIVFDSASWSSGGVNIGPETAPETFTFARNLWFCSDAPERSAPTLPTAERDGVIGTDPALDADLRVPQRGSTQGRGAEAAPPAQGRSVGSAL